MACVLKVLVLDVVVALILCLPVDLGPDGWRGWAATVLAVASIGLVLAALFVGMVTLGIWVLTCD